MKHLIGLGNPGKKYEKNRHNVGFMFIDYLLQTQNSKIKAQNHSLKLKTKDTNTNTIWQKSSEGSLLYVWQDTEWGKIEYVKPVTFMNDSGKAVSYVVKKHNIDDIVIIHDDLDISLGSFKIQKGKGPKLHNGIESIEQALGTEDFLRVRIGVDNRDSENRIPGEAYVLQDFTKEEKEKLQKVFEEIFEKLFL